MEEFFDILKTKNSLPDGSTPLPDVPPSLADKIAAATSSITTSQAAAAAAASSSSSDRFSSSSIDNGGCSSTTGSCDRQQLVEAALLLDQQQHPRHQPLMQPHQHYHNLGSADYYGDAPDPAVSISGLGLEVELDDVLFGYHPERQVSGCECA